MSTLAATYEKHASPLVERIATASVAQLLAHYPESEEFLHSLGLLSGATLSLTLREAAEQLTPAERRERGVEPDRVEELFEEFMEAAAMLLGEPVPLKELTILPGRDKSGAPEAFGTLTLRRGDVVCIVGPTGAGKSRLLADIEWLADGDSPTGRRVLLDGKGRNESTQGEIGGTGLVAQLSQNMNFVIDLRVQEFLELHAESRGITDRAKVVAETLKAANDLAGEPFDQNTPVTSLSGGQSRALMIADTALISRSPIVLIDEIENAGIDRSKALELLTGAEKIVLMATHDPLLALRASRRVVISGGGIRAVLQRTEAEEEALLRLGDIDRVVQQCRQAIRSGSEVRPELTEIDTQSKEGGTANVLFSVSGSA